MRPCKPIFAHKNDIVFISKLLAGELYNMLINDPRISQEISSVLKGRGCDNLDYNSVIIRKSGE